MKSLQVLTPNRKCIFNCPFCISKTHSHQNQFKNLYEDNYSIWESNFINILSYNHDLKNIVITGTNEPMQDKKCIKDIINITRTYRKDINIELQTRYYKKDDLFDALDVVAFSVSNFEVLKKIEKTNITTRIVILLTDSFNNKTLNEILKQMNPKIEQLTFKILHDSHGYNPELDHWIETHKTDLNTIEKLKKDIKEYKGNVRIKFDWNCMDAKNRYMVFREDGNLYSNFESR